jgi:hypothetical protein
MRGRLVHGQRHETEGERQRRESARDHDRPKMDSAAHTMSIGS